jgi:uncharacterized protein (DUF1697 family)
MTHVALLRGINVSGQKRVKMAELVALFASLGLRGVRTCVQSGNVLFEAPEAGAPTLAARIERAIEERFGFAVEVILRTAEDLEKVVAGSPFAGDPSAGDVRVYVTFLKTAPEKRLVSSLAMNEAEGERYAVRGREIYLFCPNGYGKTKLGNVAFEKKLGVVATTRNWKTTTTLLELTRAPRG